MRRLGVWVACLAAVLALAGAADARTILLGVLGDAERFERQTGQQSTVRHAILGWEQGLSWGSRLSVTIPGLGPVPMIGIGTGRGWPDRREAITPRQIAMGEGDAYLFALNEAIAAWGNLLYLRPFGEMNGHWNFYCAYRRNGTLKGRSHSTVIFRKAFARLYLIAHGGTAEEINAELARLGLPPIDRDLAVNPTSLLRVVWNPQGYGNPDVPGNSAQAYYPGDAFVDVVGDDLYHIAGDAEWEAAEALYRAHPSKPFVFPEWGLWGLDDPAFIRRMHRFLLAHDRVEMISYFNAQPGSRFDLETKPASRRLYRRLIVDDLRARGLAAAASTTHAPAPS